MSFILHINTSDLRGGAAAIAHQLHQACLRNGLDSRMAVGFKLGNDPTVHVLQNDCERSMYSRTLLRVSKVFDRLQGRVRGASKLKRFLEFAAEPLRNFRILRGMEDFDFPGTPQILTGPKPAVVHCHNLHGGYFDLNVLTQLSQTVPVILTLHDCWLLSGHCAHSLDCEKWKTGCGDCPYLSVYPAVHRDQTSFNWKRKRKILQRSSLYVAAPSQWLIDKVSNSILADAVLDMRLIPHGVDTSIFRPGDRRLARKKIGVAEDSMILVSVGNRLRSNEFKDFKTLHSAFEMLARRNPEQKFVLLAVGEEGRPEVVERSEMRFIRYLIGPTDMVSYYQAADLYVHSAKADTFPTTVLEALACGVPVVATDVGGIPEQIRTTDMPTGMLVKMSDSESMCRSFEQLLFDRQLRLNMGVNAATDAAQRFTAERMQSEYLSWYKEMLISDE
jgi:glycosyltransferase involved in cell wall biosynthesis